MTTTYDWFEEVMIRRPAMSLERLHTLISIHDEELFLKELSKQPDFMEAIRPASSALHAAMKKHDGKKQKKLVVSCYKYLARMAARPTPFGLFSVSLFGKLGDKTDAQKELHPHVTTHLDANFIYGIAEMLSREKDIAETIRYYSNNSCYRILDEIRYVEAPFDQDNMRFRYRLASVKYSSPLFALLEYCDTGKKSDEMIGFMSQLGYPEQNSRTFLKELINNQLLISELVPPLTCKDYLQHILGVLSTYDLQNPKVEKLMEVDRLLRSLQDNATNAEETELEIYQILHTLVPAEKPPGLVKHLLASKGTDITIDRKIARKVMEGIVVLAKFTPRQNIQRLDDFKRKFAERFEQQEIDLAFALDVDSGIGYGKKNTFHASKTPLLDHLRFSSKEDAYNQPQEFLEEKVLNNLIKKEVLTLSDADLPHFSSCTPGDFPDTFSCMIEITDRIDEDHEKIHIKWAGGTSASMIPGRFTPYSEEARRLVEKIYATEQQLNEKALVAEIVHQPEGKAGNIVHRAVTRRYEVPYMGRSSLSVSNQIDIRDIMISLKNDELILKSKRLGKRIFPRLSNAHDYFGDTLPIYNLLCDLQHQNRMGLGFGFDLRSQLLAIGYMPRIEYKNLVLSPKSWAITGTEHTELLHERSPATLKKLLWKWKEEIQLPDAFFVRKDLDDDRELYINLNSEPGRMVFQDFLKKYPMVFLREFFGSPNQQYVQEVMISYYRKNGKSS